VTGCALTKRPGLSTRCVAAAVAIALAAGPAWGHAFPPVRTVVLQVERCELVIMVGYRPASGESTDAILSRVASQPKSRRLDAMRETLSAYAMAPLAVTLDGKPLIPSSVHAKIGLEPGGARPMVVVLVTYAIGAGGALAITSKEPRTTRISWQDQNSGRVDLTTAPAQGKGFGQVASFLLSLSVPTGDMACRLSTKSD
jgi:hypothetical protein